MARPKIIPDSEVFDTVLRLMAASGEAGLSFAAVGRACGLAPATLVQRFGSQETMVRRAVAAGWDAADAAIAAIGPGRHVHQMLKALPDCTLLLAASRRDAGLRGRAASWRQQVEGALALRFGSGAKAKETAALMFAVWQGQAAWTDAGDKGFRLKDAAKRLG